MYHCAWDGDETAWDLCQMVRYDFLKYETKVIQWEGIDIGIPESPAHYLKQHFGDSWHTPNEGHWHWAKSCPNAWYTKIFMNRTQDIRDVIK